MLQACMSQGRRSSIALASTSQCSLLHTSAILQKSRLTSLQTRRDNIEKQEERRKVAMANRASPVLGVRPSETYKWDNCDLAKIIVDESKLRDREEEVLEIPQLGSVNVPKLRAFGVGETEKELLLEKLPLATAEMHVSKLQANQQAQYLQVSDGLKALETAGTKEIEKATAFARLLDLRNANAAGIAYANRRRIIAAFSTPENPFDPGRPEVQAALLTYKIRKLWTHLTTFKRDIGNRLGLRKLVHKRAKILKYLKRVDRERYDDVLTRLALEPESVEGELVV
ncbi:hypothetical protein BDQ17DRAFT_1278510 [Cyathus striatus]|nr:hypothetical protein BDQ17DRAFT_1278510 [Cyathus striatus]